MRVLWIGALLLASGLVLSSARADSRGERFVADDDFDAVSKVEGFSLDYRAVPTPRAEWEGDRSIDDWFDRFAGRLTTKKVLAYRKSELPPGSHDVWIEAGKKDWWILWIGNRLDPEKPRLKAQFKLYEEEEGVEALSFELKLVRKATKLKFSVRGGLFEGHGNLRIPAPPQPK